MKNKLFSNLGLKLLSVILGFIVWLVVLNLDDYAVTRRINNIPVEILNENAITDQNQLFDITEGETVDIIVKGRRSIVNELVVSDFKATADLSKLSLTNAVPITITTVNESLENSLSITMVNSVLVIELEEEETISLPVMVAANGTVEEGYTVGAAVATPNLITVSGAASVVNSIDRVEVQVDVSGRNADVSATCSPVFYDKNNEVIPENKIECEVGTVDVTVPIYRTKTVALKLSTVGAPEDMYEITDIECAPDKIMIGAPANVLSRISEIKIDDLDVEGCTEDIETTIDIVRYLPENVVLADGNDTISVRIIVKRNINKSISLTASDITIKNQEPDTLYDITMPANSNVIIRGLSDEISGITADDLGIVIDAAELEYGENQVTLHIADGENFTVDNTVEITVSVYKMP